MLLVEGTCISSSPSFDTLCFSGRSKKKDKCKNTQMYPLSETQYCPCNKYNAWPVGNWSDCILPERGSVDDVLGLKVPGDIKHCGQGYRYQAMACYDQDNRLVETARCNSHGQHKNSHVCIYSFSSAALKIMADGRTPQQNRAAMGSAG